MTALKVIPGRDWPIDAVTQKFAWLGRTGSGKSYACKRFVEQMLRAGAQVLIVDTVGVWHGLRQGDHGFDIPVLGGLYGDIPLEPTAGALVAEVAVQSSSSMVLDVSQMNDAQRARFMEALGRRLFELKKASPSAMHLVLDEGQDTVPQNPQPNESMMLHEWVRICKQGRAFGMGVSIVSQRPQEISKKALNQVECVLAFQLTGAHERKALEYWLSDKGIDTKLAQTLPTLPIGVPFLWSPQWLKVAEVTRRVLPIESADTSQTPKVGDAPRARAAMKPIDLHALEKSMGEMVERVKESDPALLKKRIQELEKQLASGASPSSFDSKRAQELVAQLRRRDKLTKAAWTDAALLVAKAEAILAQARTDLDVGAQVPDVEVLLLEEFLTGQRAAAPARSASPPPRRPPRPGREHQAPTLKEKGGLPAGDAAVLQAIAQYGDRGVGPSTIMVMTGYKKSYVNLCINNLRSHADGPLVDRPSPGHLKINALGLRHVPKDFKRLPVGKKLVQHLIDTLPLGESSILKCIATAHPGEVSLQEVSADTGYKKSYINLCVQSLVSRRAIRRARPGVVTIHPEVFA